MPRLPAFPHFSYPVTREIQWRVESLAYLAAFLAVVILIPVNYALTGYETVSVTNQDYNYIPNNWYYRFAPRPKPGSHCDPHMFTIGDSFVTNTSILTYKLVTALGSDDGINAKSSINYKGTTLENCDVFYMSVAADARLLTSTIVADIGCTNETGFPIAFSTSYATSFDRVSSNLWQDVNYHLGDMKGYNDLSLNVSLLLYAAGLDLINHVQFMFKNIANGPAVISVSTPYLDGYPPWWCPTTTSAANSTCKTAIPEISLGEATLIGAIGNFINASDAPGLAGNYTLAVTNAMQVTLAAVRTDLGNILPNNMLVNRNPSLINATIAPMFPADPDIVSTLYTDLITPDTAASENSDAWDPVDISEAERYPSNIAVDYLCRTEQHKSPGSILVAVSVATLTFVKTGWAVFLLILTVLAKHAQPEGCRACADYENLEARMREPERRESAIDSAPRLGRLEKEG
ncbi:hypothetical protein FRB96_002607 [Tulasnella sp. 330]|nr:hypothetical protein FRB96_002607 [Tulasnella sp. 330]